MRERERETKRKIEVKEDIKNIKTKGERKRETKRKIEVEEEDIKKKKKTKGEKNKRERVFYLSSKG